MDSARIFATVFEFLPIVLALIALLRLMFVWKESNYKLLITLGAISCASLISLQLSWFQTFIIEGNHMASVLISNGWTIHNALSMIILIIIAKTCK